MWIVSKLEVSLGDFVCVETGVKVHNLLPQCLLTSYSVLIHTPFPS